MLKDIKLNNKGLLTKPHYPNLLNTLRATVLLDIISNSKVDNDTCYMCDIYIDVCVHMT